MQIRRARALAASFVLAAALCVASGGAASANAGDARQIVAGARVVAIADRLAHEAVTGSDRAVEPAYQIPDQNIPAGTVVLAAAGSALVTSTYVSVPVAIRVNGKLATTVVAGYRVTTFVHTAVATHDLAPGAVLTLDDVAFARVASNGRPAVGFEALIGRKLNVATPKGTALYVEQTMPNPLVKPGQAAILVIHDGPVALTADVIARTGGALGDTVTVLNPQTQKAIAAIVTGPNRVELTLPTGAQQ
jgi:flagella basal body P-ring formation protein FlgA